MKVLAGMCGPNVLASGISVTIPFLILFQLMEVIK